MWKSIDKLASHLFGYNNTNLEEDIDKNDKKDKFHAPESPEITMEDSVNENNEIEWCGRKILYTNIELSVSENSKSSFTLKKKSNNICVLSNDKLLIKFKWKSIWSYNEQDYCPGCIVQVYYGIQNHFSKGFIEYGIQNSRGYCSYEFFAPKLPGIYYITQQISLDYNYITVNHENTKEKAIAAIQVYPRLWSPKIHRLYSEVDQKIIEQILHLNQFNTHFKKLSDDELHSIFKFL